MSTGAQNEPSLLSCGHPTRPGLCSCYCSFHRATTSHATILHGFPGDRCLDLGSCHCAWTWTNGPIWMLARYPHPQIVGAPRPVHVLSRAPPSGHRLALPAHRADCAIGYRLCGRSRLSIDAIYAIDGSGLSLAPSDRRDPEGRA
jgi:hypothetical protein